MSGLMPEAMKVKLPSKKPRKKKGRKPVVVMFDKEARREYLTGFQKRKQQRREKVSLLRHGARLSVTNTMILQQSHSPMCFCSGHCRFRRKSAAREVKREA